MNGWPYISRARVIRFNLAFGLLCLALAILVFIVSRVGGSQDQLDGFTIWFGGLGILALLGVWAMRRDQAREAAAGDRTSPEQR